MEQTNEGFEDIRKECYSLITHIFLKYPYISSLVKKAISKNFSIKDMRYIHDELEEIVEKCQLRNVEEKNDYFENRPLILDLLPEVLPYWSFFLGIQHSTSSRSEIFIYAG